jgi:hypothetical protein
MAWVAQQKGAQLSPDGTLRVPLQGTGANAILQAQRVLAAWAQDSA